MYVRCTITETSASSQLANASSSNTKISYFNPDRSYLLVLGARSELDYNIFTLV